MEGNSQKNKRGSVAITVIMLMTGLLILITAYIHASKTLAVRGCTREMGLMWCESVLGEYDLNLQRRYGIFGFYGTVDEIGEKIDRYAMCSFRGKKYVDYKGAAVQLFDYSLESPLNVRKQVVAMGKYVAAGDLVKPIPEIRAWKDGSSCVRGGEEIWTELPSEGSSGGLSVAALKAALEGLSDPGEVVKEGTDRYFENRYILRYFSHEGEKNDLGNTYLDGEVEYILCGKHTDEENRKGVRARITAIRFAANMVYILKDPKMNGETMAVAEVITPGPAAVVTQKALQSAWALAESNNDYKLLMNGKKVPMVKTQHSWAIDLESITGGKVKEEENPKFKSKVPYVDPGNTAGQEYRDYLELLCYLMDSDVKILRLMDLIQINMRCFYYGNFRLKDYNGGLRCVLRVNDEEQEIAKVYQGKP